MSRTKTSKAWMREHVTDAWVRKAKSDGYRSRAAFKLMQIDERDRILRAGAWVVDLGAAPGGWSQVAADRVGPTGRVVAVDLLEMAPLPGVRFVRGDFGDDGVLAQMESLLEGRRVDLVLSDMAPNLSGIAGVDQARGAYLAELALDFARTHLSSNGVMVVKVFHGEGFDALMREIRAGFRKVAVRKPEASRGRSSETYVVARDPVQNDAPEPSEREV
ncbi:MAG: RlmE family RNA methyltransferase [Betaproteobacteria bacterium]|nr:RlmE family RNA methyltransferase [Betaproteobacteria bacterium]